VTNNMFGDIITDLAAGLQGGLGMAASGNLHPGKTPMFEPVHGSAPPIAGKNIANPFGAILTAAMMLAHLGMKAEAERIEAAVLDAVRGKKTTADIGGTLGTREAGEWVAERVANGLKHSKFKAYVGDPDFHDGVIERVCQEATEISVEISGYSGTRYKVRFSGVESVISHNPEGMVLYALSEVEAEFPLREFHFANSSEPDEDGGDSRLAIIARGFSVEKI